MKRRPLGGGDGSRPVYSTDPGFVPPCARCGRPPAECVCRREEGPARKGAARVRLERKGRGGKVVTVIDSLGGSRETLEEVARALKEACGTGGTVKGGSIELQGDHRERAAAALSARGYRPRLAGG